MEAMSNRALKGHFSLRLLSFIILSAACSLHATPAEAESWEAHDSEAEAYTILSQLFQTAELPSSKIKRGSYPLFMKGAKRASFPLMSAPCPLLNDCESLITTIRSSLLNRGYHIVYSDQKAREGGPIHFAIAKGQRPIMALRLMPAATSSLLLLHLNSGLDTIQRLFELNPHLNYIVSERIAANERALIEWLDDQRREYLLELDDLSIKRALLNPSTGDLIMDPKARREAIYHLLVDRVKLAPNSVGFYLDQEVNYALDRNVLNELVDFCAKQHRILVLSDVHDELPRYVAQTKGVRSFVLYSHSKESVLTEKLRSIETQLVLDGEAAAEFELKDVSDWPIFYEWLEKLNTRDVSLLRLSEAAW